VRICLMIEGQEGVTWENWVALAQACERLGFDALFRSDHYLSVDGRGERGSLDAWATVCALGALTSTLRFGTMVSPATFRHPSALAKTVVTADHISGGRVELGIGAGWWEREHEAYGFALPAIGPRMDALEEQLQLIGMQWEDGPFSLEGRFWSVENLDAQPKPVQRPRPPLILGAKGGPRSLRLAARFADEYNTVFLLPEEVRDLRRRLDAACEAVDRDPATLPLSMMTSWMVGADRRELVERATRLARWKGEGADGEAFLAAMRAPTIKGTVPEALEQLEALREAGLTRVMAQHLLHRDLDAVELLGREVVPALSR
jgi:F420-dependent oxidoreductase-like protein